jgi:hypothetical protein
METSNVIKDDHIFAGNVENQMEVYGDANILKNKNPPKLTKLEEKCIIHYTGEGFCDLNDLFSSHGMPSEKQYIKFINIWNALDRNRMENSVTVYRGVEKIDGTKIFFQNPEGTNFSTEIQRTRCFSTFMSTSSSLEQAIGFTNVNDELGIGGIVLEIRLKQNSRAMNVEMFSQVEEEKEILVAPGFLKILEIKTRYINFQNDFNGEMTTDYNGTSVFNLPYKIFVCSYDNMNDNGKCMMSMPIFQIRKMINNENTYCRQNNKDCGGVLFYCYNCHEYFCKNHEDEFHLKSYNYIKNKNEDDDEDIENKGYHYIYEINNILKKTYNPSLLEETKAKFGMKIRKASKKIKKKTNKRKSARKSAKKSNRKSARKRSRNNLN